MNIEKFINTYIINNLDKISFGLGCIFIGEIIIKYNNLSKNEEYMNIKIKKELIYQIAIYKKININNISFTKPLELYDKFLNSFTLIFNNLENKVYNNVEFYKPDKYIDHDKTKINDIIKNNVYLENHYMFLNKICKYQNENNIFFRIINPCYGYCLYDNNKLVYISNNKIDVLFMSINNNLKYFYINLIFGMYAYFHINKT